MHDELTGLPNRACFYDRTDQALRLASRDGTCTAVLLFDLNRFKDINDTLGHKFGDKVLREVGPRLRRGLRDSDTLARLGGDEFCVLLPRVEGVGDALVVAKRIIEPARGALRHRRDDHAGRGQLRGRDRSRGRRQRRSAAAARRRGDVRGQGLARQHRDLRRRAQHKHPSPLGPPERAPGCGFRWPVRPVLPAQGRPGRKERARCRSPGPLAAPHVRPRPAERLHPAGRAHGAHQAPHHLGAQHGSRAAQPLAGNER